MKIAISMGDPAGIGPEIIVKALASGDCPGEYIVVGDALIMGRAIDQFAPGMALDVVSDPSAAAIEPDRITLCPVTPHLEAIPAAGEVAAVSGLSAFNAIVKSIELARAESVAAIVTAPIHKAAFAAAGIDYPGHTEILADYGGSEAVAMMLANDELRTVLVTIHCSLREAIERADFAAQLQAINLADQGAKAYGITQPRIAVAGLNPHAGENGLFGDEENQIIRPAIDAARATGIDVSGPWPGDTVFMQARQGRFDIVVAQYHDQGLIPIKYLGLEKGVNVTLGLPFIRTSPDHGTAFDIAGQGIADPTSLKTALAHARLLTGNPGRA